MCFLVKASGTPDARSTPKQVGRGPRSHGSKADRRKSSTACPVTAERRLGDEQPEFGMAIKERYFPDDAIQSPDMSGLLDDQK